MELRSHLLYVPLVLFVLLFLLQPFSFGSCLPSCLWDKHRLQHLSNVTISKTIEQHQPKSANGASNTTSVPNSIVSNVLPDLSPRPGHGSCQAPRTQKSQAQQQLHNSGRVVDTKRRRKIFHDADKDLHNQQYAPIIPTSVSAKADLSPTTNLRTINTSTAKETKATRRRPRKSKPNQAYKHLCGKARKC